MRSDLPRLRRYLACECRRRRLPRNNDAGAIERARTLVGLRARVRVAAGTSALVHRDAKPALALVELRRGFCMVRTSLSLPTIVIVIFSNCIDPPTTSPCAHNSPTLENNKATARW